MGEREIEKEEGERERHKKKRRRGGEGRKIVLSPTEGEKLDTLIKKVERW